MSMCIAVTDWEDASHRAFGRGCRRRFDQDGVEVKNQFKSVAGDFAKDTVEQWSQRLIKNIWKLGARDAVRPTFCSCGFFVKKRPLRGMYFRLNYHLHVLFVVGEFAFLGEAVCLS
jgi:hypothetical protein